MTSLVVLTVIYAVLLVVEVKLLVKYVRGGVASSMPELKHAPAEKSDDETPPGGTPGKPEGDDVLAFAY
jgi:cytochrome d ubiquinol oxidase subunit I